MLAQKKSVDMHTTTDASQAPIHREDEEDRGGLRLGTLAEIMAASKDANGPFIPTEQPDLAVLVDRGGLRLRAVLRACPHRGYDLIENGSLTSDGEALACWHRGYSWAAADGRPLSCGHRGPTGALSLLPTRVDDDGVVWTMPIREEVSS